MKEGNREKHQSTDRDSATESEKKELARIAAREAERRSKRFAFWALGALVIVGVIAYLGSELLSGVSSAALFMIYVAWRLDQIARNTAGTYRELQRINDR